MLETENQFVVYRNPLPSFFVYTNDVCKCHKPIHVEYYDSIERLRLILEEINKEESYITRTSSNYE